MVECISRRRALAFAAGALGAAACSFLVDPNAAQCDTTADCARRGGAFADTLCLGGFCRAGDGAGGGDASAAGGGGGPPLPPAWSCLARPPPAGELPAEVDVGMRFDDYDGNRPVAGLRVKACRRLDAACATPLAEGVTDAAGAVTFRVPTKADGDAAPTGFSGFAEVRGPEGEGPDGTMPMLIFFSPPIVADEVSPPYLDMTTFRKSQVEALVQLSSGPYDPSKGNVIFFANGCDGKRSAGVHFEVAGGAGEMVGFYMVSGLPSATSRATDASGIGGFARAPVTILNVTASVWDEASGGPLATIDELQVLTRADWVTVSRVAPRARQ